VLSTRDRRIAEQLKRRLTAEHIPLLDFKVFGSRARGDAHPESDLDVFLLLSQRNRRIEDAIDQIAWEVGFENGRLIMTVECTQAEMQAAPWRLAELLEEVAREGLPV